MCRYTTVKNADAPVECMYRMIHPYSTSRMMYSTEANARSAEGSKLMVSQIPVSSWLTSTSRDRTPKKYQMLKFLGA